MGTARAQGSKGAMGSSDAEAATRMTVIKVNRGKDTRKSGGVSKALDPSSGWDFGIGPTQQIAPRADPDYLADQPNRSQSLKACGNAIATNVYAMGHTLTPRRKPNGAKEEAEALAEKEMLDDFFDSASPESSWLQTCYAFGYDRTIVGYGVIEVLRNNKNEVCGLTHHPSRHFRVTGFDRDPTEAQYRRWDAKMGRWVEMTYDRRFRRYVQNVNGRLRFFKEFGDPRVLNMDSGNYSEATPADKVAGEVIFDATYDPTTPYGFPDWIPLWDDTEADHSASTGSKDFLEDGLPLALIFTPNSTVTGSARKALTEAIEDAKATGKARTKVVIMDSVPVESKAAPGQAASTANAATPQVVKLGDLQQGDALYREFRKEHHRRVRIAFRLSGLFLGEDDQATYATANIQMQMAEMQVFIPKRIAFDHLVNNRVLPELGAKWWKYQSKGPVLQDNQTWIRLMELAYKSGAIRDFPLFRKILSEQLGDELPSGDADGVLAEYEKMPPGYVEIMVQALRVLPTMADFAAALPLPADGSEVSKPVPTGRNVARSDDAVVDQIAMVWAKAIVRAREMLTEASEEAS